MDLRVYGNVTNATATHLASYLARNVSVSINALNATAVDAFRHTAVVRFAADPWLRGLRESVWLVVGVNPLCLERRALRLEAMLLLSEYPAAPLPSVSQATVAVAGIAGIVGGTFSLSVALQAGRSLFDQSMATCTIADDTMSILDSPLQLSLGSSAAAVHTGTAVGNAAVMLMFVAGQALLALLCVATGLRGSAVEAFALVRLPSWTSFPVLLLLQSTVTCAVVSVLVAEPAWAAASGLVLVCLLACVGMVGVRMRHGFDAHYVGDARSYGSGVAGVVSGGARAKAEFLRFLYGTGKWHGGGDHAAAKVEDPAGMFSEVGSGHFVAASGEPVEMHDITHTPAQPPAQLPSNTSAGQLHVLHGLGIAIEADVERLFLETHTFLDQYRLLFNDYNGANRSFVCVDAGLSVLVGMIGGLRAVVPNCIGLSCVVLLLFVVFLVTVVLRRPYNSSFLYWFTVVMTGGQAANALLTVVYVIGNEGDGGVSVALDVVTWISTVLAYLLLFRTATDAIPKGYIFYRKMRALVRGRVDAHGVMEVKDEGVVPLLEVVERLSGGGSLNSSFVLSRPDGDAIIEAEVEGAVVAAVTRPAENDDRREVELRSAAAFDRESHQMESVILSQPRDTHDRLQDSEKLLDDSGNLAKDEMLAELHTTHFPLREQLVSEFVMQRLELGAELEENDDLKRHSNGVDVDSFIYDCEVTDEDFSAAYDAILSFPS